jgi:hypothetical protein
MNAIEKEERKRQARVRLRAQRRRAGQLRSRVVAISMIFFVLLWGIVFTQMATGNDPVLGDKPPAFKSVATAAQQHRAEAESAAAAEAELLEAESASTAEAELLEAQAQEELELESLELESVTTSQS